MNGKDMNNNGKGVQATSLNEYTQRNHKGCFYTAKARPTFICRF